MSALPLFRRALADSWRGLLGWMLGLAAVVGMYLPTDRDPDAWVQSGTAVIMNLDT